MSYRIKQEFDRPNLLKNELEIIYQEYIDFSEVLGYDVEFDVQDNTTLFSYSFRKNTSGDIVPILIFNDQTSYTADFQDYYIYVGVDTIDGIEYDKWQKIEVQYDGKYYEFGFDSETKAFIYTNIVVEEGTPRNYLYIDSNLTLTGCITDTLYPAQFNLYRIPEYDESIWPQPDAELISLLSFTTDLANNTLGLPYISDLSNINVSLGDWKESFSDDGIYYLSITLGDTDTTWNVQSNAVEVSIESLPSPSSIIVDLNLSDDLVLIGYINTSKTASSGYVWSIDSWCLYYSDNDGMTFSSVVDSSYLMQLDIPFDENFEITLKDKLEYFSIPVEDGKYKFILSGSNTGNEEFSAESNVANYEEVDESDVKYFNNEELNSLWNRLVRAVNKLSIETSWGPATFDNSNMQGNVWLNTTYNVIETIDAIEYSIYNSAGTVVKSGYGYYDDSMIEQTTTPLTDLPNGTYTVETTSSGATGDDTLVGLQGTLTIGSGDDASLKTGSIKWVHDKLISYTKLSHENTPTKPADYMKGIAVCARKIGGASNTDLQPGVYEHGSNFTKLLYSINAIKGSDFGENNDNYYYWDATEGEAEINIGGDLVLPNDGTISGLALSYCGNIIIPEGVEHLELSCFSTGGFSVLGDATECKMESLYIKATTPPGLNGNGFPYLTKIVVPKGCGDVYKSAAGWRDFEDIIIEGEMPSVLSTLEQIVTYLENPQLGTTWTNDDIDLTAIITQNDSYTQLNGSYTISIANSNKIATNNLSYRYDWTCNNGSSIEPNGGENTSFIDLERSGPGNYTLTVTCSGTLIDEYGNISTINKTATASGNYEVAEWDVSLELTESNGIYTLTITDFLATYCNLEYIKLYKDNSEYADLTSEIGNIQSGTYRLTFDITEFIDVPGEYFVRFKFDVDDNSYVDSDPLTVEEAETEITGLQLSINYPYLEIVPQYTVVDSTSHELEVEYTIEVWDVTMDSTLKETYVLRNATLGDDTTIHLLALCDSYNIDSYYEFAVEAYVPETGQTYANIANVTWDNSWTTEPGIQLSESSYTLTGYIPESEDNGYTLSDILICDDTGDFDRLSYSSLSEFNSALADGITLTTVHGKTNVHVEVYLYNSSTTEDKIYTSNYINTDGDDNGGESNHEVTLEASISQFGDNYTGTLQAEYEVHVDGNFVNANIETESYVWKYDGTVQEGDTSSELYLDGNYGTYTVEITISGSAWDSVSGDSVYFTDLKGSAIYVI